MDYHHHHHYDHHHHHHHHHHYGTTFITTVATTTSHHLSQPSFSAIASATAIPVSAPATTPWDMCNKSVATA
jgi:hypothetical protein